MKRENGASHFVESYPVYLPASAEGAVPQAHFCYVDEGLQTTDRFATYLNQYGRVFAALGAFHVIYVAERPRLFASAERIFQRLIGSFLGSPEPVDAEQQQLFAYFQRRRCYENQDFSNFDMATLIRFREEKQRFSSASYDRLYTQWKAGDLPSLGNDLQTETPRRGTSVQQFSTYLLEHDYDLFGSLTREYDKRTNDEIQTES